MEPVSTLATIVGLMASFKAERTSQSAIEYEEYVSWLDKNNHQEIIEYLRINTAATVSIKAILNINNKMLFARLQTIDEMLASLISGFSEFKSLACAIHPNSELSEQASSIIKQLIDSKASSFIEVKSCSEPNEYLLFEKSGEITYQEEQFIEDDLLNLVKLGLLNLAHTKSGTRQFFITRLAAKIYA